MAIQPTDIVFYHSGSGTNVTGDPDGGTPSLGGAKSAIPIGENLHDLFDKVTGAQSATGLDEYRCIYVSNDTGGGLVLQSAVAFIQAQTAGADNRIQIGAGVAGVNNPEVAIGTETEVPAGVIFSQPTNVSTGLGLGNIPAGQYAGIWIKRIVDADAAAHSNETATITVSGDTAE